MSTSIRQSPNYHSYSQTRHHVTKDTDSEVVEFNEEREEEEYIYAPHSTASDTATIQFLTDDRVDSSKEDWNNNFQVNLILSFSVLLPFSFTNFSRFLALSQLVVLSD
jgi:hypothetical protein